MTEFRFGLKRLLILVASIFGILLFESCRTGPTESPASDWDRVVALKRGGEISAAVDLAGSAMVRYRPDPYWHWRFRLFKADILLHQRSPEAAALLNTPDIAMPQLPELQSRRLLCLANLASNRSENLESLRLVSDALQKALATGLMDMAGEAHIQRALLLIEMSESARAEADFYSAIRIAKDIRDRFIEARAAGNLGYWYVRSGRYDAGISVLDRLLQDTRMPLSQVQRAQCLTNMGHSYFRLGDIDRAAELLARAAPIYEAQRLTAELRKNQNNQGVVAYRRKDYLNARRFFGQAVELARRQENKEGLADSLVNLAATQLAAGETKDARQSNHEAAAVALALHSEDIQLRSKLNEARLDAAGGRKKEALAAFREIASHSGAEPGLLLDAHTETAGLLASDGRNDLANRSYRSAMALLDSSRSKLLRDESKLSYVSSLVDVVRSYVAFLIRAGRKNEALEVAESSRARLLAETLRTKPDFKADQLIALAATTQTALLSYWIAPEKSWLWVINEGKITPFELPGENTLRGLVENYRERLVEARQDPISIPSLTGRELFATLLGPALPLITKNGRVAIVPDGPLHFLNFETLPVGDDKPHFWLEDATITVVPSLSFLLAKQPRTPARQPLLLIGDPVSPDEKTYPRLIHAAEEIKEIQRVFPKAPTYKGSDAQPGCYRDAKPEGFAMIHFASHAEANRDSPLDSAVILSRKDDRFKLYARDIRESKLNADLVTVSACRSAGSRIYAGEGLVGFAWAFLDSGARNVIAGLWEVDDEATSQLMGSLYRRLRDGVKPAKALHEAKLEMLHQGGKHQSPFYWAPFQVFSTSLEP